MAQRTSLSLKINFVPDEFQFVLKPQNNIPPSLHEGVLYINANYYSCMTNGTVQIKLRYFCLTKEFNRIIPKLGKACTASVPYTAFFCENRNINNDIPNDNTDCWDLELARSTRKRTSPSKVDQLLDMFSDDYALELPHTRLMPLDDTPPIPVDTTQYSPRAPSTHI
mgnify:CR=1 FL=1